LLVASFIAAYVTNWLGVSYFTYHLWSGYFVIVLVGFRILWGIFGTHHARFANFVRHPLESVRYAKHLVKNKAQSYPGHNPLGALMVLLLLSVMMIQAATGLFANDEIFNAGPLYGYISNQLSLQLTSVHKELFYWILAAVTLHVAAVLFYVLVKRENLIKAMITGKKPRHGFEHARAIESSRIWLALFLIVLVSAVLAWVIITAPEVVLDLGY
jgi:cytochrome b